MNYQRDNLRNSPFTLVSERIKYLEVILMKKMKNLYSKKHKTLIKEIEDNTNNRKVYCAHGWKTKYC